MPSTYWNVILLSYWYAYANKDLRTLIWQIMFVWFVLMSGRTVSFACFYFSVPSSIWSFFLLLCFHFLAKINIGMLELKRKCSCATEMVFHLSSECEEKCQTLIFTVRINFMLYDFFSDPFFCHFLVLDPFILFTKDHEKWPVIKQEWIFNVM